MGAGRRLRREGDREWARRARRELDPEAVVAASQTLLDTWPWLTEQYRQGIPPELPMAAVGAAIRRYLEHAGIDPQ
jgi:uroporphyrinogen-III synthase